jgi:hypothetical protein
MTTARVKRMQPAIIPDFCDWVRPDEAAAAGVCVAVAVAVVVAEIVGSVEGVWLK